MDISSRASSVARTRSKVAARRAAHPFPRSRGVLVKTGAASPGSLPHPSYSPPHSLSFPLLLPPSVPPSRLVNTLLPTWLYAFVAPFVPTASGS